MDEQRWCACPVVEDAELNEGVCPTCGLPERAWHVGAVLAQLDNLDHAQSVEALEEALAWHTTKDAPKPPAALAQPLPGDVLICTYPDGSQRQPPWKTRVLWAEPRVGGGWIACVERRAPCTCCKRAYPNENPVLGCEWFSAPPRMVAVAPHAFRVIWRRDGHGETARTPDLAFAEAWGILAMWREANTNPAETAAIYGVTADGEVACSVYA